MKKTVIGTVKNDLMKRAEKGENIQLLDTSAYSVALALQHGFKPTTVERCFRQVKNNEAIKTLYSTVNTNNSTVSYF